MAEKIITTSGFKHRPLPIKVFNGLGGALVGPVKIDNLLRAAKKKTGLDDFGEENFRPALEKLIDSVNHEAKLHAFGRFVIKQRIVGLLANRLRAQYFFSKHPEILGTQLPPPVIITGLQRTGTTFLQRLLSADPSNRSLYSWETLNPAPQTNYKKGDNKTRLKEAKTAEQALRFLSPGFFAIHPVEHDATEEDILLLDISFLSTVPEATMDVPTYSSWVEKESQVPAYRYERKLLHLLNWQRSGERFILKSPHHLEFLDDLFNVFPNAKIIHTHRDPYKTLPSFCNMISYGRAIFSDHVDPKLVAQHWTNKCARMVNRSIESRQRIGDDKFLDISYYDLIKGPVETVRQIYQFLGTDFSSAVQENVEQKLTTNRQHKYGVHQYSMEAFGLTQAYIDELFGHYRETFNVPVESR